MSWVTVTWSVIIGICLTFSAVHAFAWLRQRESAASFWFALLALATAGLAMGELVMMGSRSPGEYSVALRWFHVPIWLAVIAIVGFVRSHLRSGRLWLGYAAIATRTATLLPNFLYPNLNYKELARLQPVEFLGELVASPTGVPNPWMLLGQASLILLILYVADAAVASWRRGARDKALVIGLPLVAFILAGLTQAILVYWGFLALPIVPSPFFLGIVLAMGFGLSREILKFNVMARELQREKALSEAIFNGAPGLIYLYTRDGRLVRWNRKHEEMTGYAAAELAGKSAADFFEGEDLAQMRREWERVFTEGRASAELMLLRKDGTKIPLLVTGVPLEIDGRPHLLGVGIDLTEQRRLAAELRLQRQELLHMNRVSSLGVLAGSIAHELNQPLGIILTNAQAAQRLLAQPAPDLGELRAILGDIVSEDRRAGDVIKRLRALLERGEPVRQPADMNEIVGDVLQLVRSDLVAREVQVVQALDATLAPVGVDRIPMQQVLLNLIMNACDAMSGNKASDRRLTIATESIGGGVRVSISDTGCGLPDHVARLFEPFYSTKSGGLGMGLAICRAIVDAHQGTLRAERNDGRGATFVIELPAGGPA